MEAQYWDGCPDAHVDLTDELSRPLKKKGSRFIAVVKGTRVTEKDPGGDLVNYIDIEKSYGRRIPKGKYAIEEESLAMSFCGNYWESPVRYDQSVDTHRSLYLVLTWVHVRDRIVVTQEARPRLAVPPWQGVLPALEQGCADALDGSGQVRAIPVQLSKGRTKERVVPPLARQIGRLNRCNSEQGDGDCRLG